MGDLDIEDLSRSVSPSISRLSNSNLPNSHLGMEAVKLIVGMNPRQKVFVLHKQLLSTRAPVFGKMIDGRFLEGTTGEATLPKDDPDIFGVFVGWLYGKRITESALRTNTYIELAKFSEKYCLVSLVDGAIEGLVKTLIARDLFLEMLHIGYSYQNTGQNSKLRPWAARSYAYVLTHWEEEPFATDSHGASENLYPRGPNAKEIILDCHRQLRP